MFASLRFFAGAGGCVGLMGLGLAPGKQTGKYQAQVDKFLGVDLSTEHEWYKLEVPGYDKYNATRSMVELDVLNVHEMLCDEFRLDPSLEHKL
jgi:hypothetical protein